MRKKHTKNGEKTISEPFLVSFSNFFRDFGVLGVWGGFYGAVWEVLGGSGLHKLVDNKAEDAHCCRWVAEVAQSVLALPQTPGWGIYSQVTKTGTTT
eukprot:6254560-Amphidinium_carterae.1